MMSVTMRRLPRSNRRRQPAVLAHLRRKESGREDAERAVEIREAIPTGRWRVHVRAAVTSDKPELVKNGQPPKHHRRRERELYPARGAGASPNGRSMPNIGARVMTSSGMLRHCAYQKRRV